jgi:hypothetical protein
MRFVRSWLLRIESKFCNQNTRFQSKVRVIADDTCHWFGHVTNEVDTVTDTLIFSRRMLISVG